MWVGLKILLYGWMGYIGVHPFKLCFGCSLGNDACGSEDGSGIFQKGSRLFVDAAESELVRHCQESVVGNITSFFGRGSECGVYENVSESSICCWFIAQWMYWRFTLIQLLFFCPGSVSIFVLIHPPFLGLLELGKLVCFYLRHCSFYNFPLFSFFGCGGKCRIHVIGFVPTLVGMFPGLSSCQCTAYCLPWTGRSHCPLFSHWGYAAFSMGKNQMISAHVRRTSRVRLQMISPFG